MSSPRATVVHVQTTIRGRVLVDRPAAPIAGALLGFHGYGETAEEQLERLRLTRAEEPWLLVSMQALHPFYRRSDRAVVASWMTRLDRELAIEDNVRYVEAVWHTIRAEHGSLPLALAGFSQGVAMAFRAAARLVPDALVVTGGDVPPELRAAGASLPPTLLTRGAHDDLYPAAQWRADAAALELLGGPVECFEHEGGHDWPVTLAEAAREFVRAQVQPPR